MANERMEGTAKKIELGSNIAIIIVAIIACALFARSYWGGGSAKPPRQVEVGAKFALKDVNWQANKTNVVLALSTGCHFCTESAGFYRQLSQQCQREGIRTIAVLPQSVNESMAYLKNEGVSVDDVRQSVLPSLEINGTPTLLIVDDHGVVRSVWVGKLPGDVEKQVLAKLAS